MDLTTLVIGCFVAYGLLLAGVVGLAVLSDRPDKPVPGEVPHFGATEHSPRIPAAPPIEFDEPASGRHHEDTVDIVPSNYWPPPERLSPADATTQRIELPCAASPSASRPAAAASSSARSATAQPSSPTSSA